MREAEEVESFWLPLSKPLPLLDRMATKADQPGFRRVQGQIEQTQPLLEVFEERSCLIFMLEADDGIIRITDVNGSRTWGQSAV